MYAAIGLMIATGIPWEYWARQDDEVVATSLHILKQAHKGSKGAGDRHESPSRASPQMSG